MKGNSSHQGDDDDGSEVPHPESERGYSLAGVDGDPIRQRELETKLEAMVKRVGVLEEKLESFHHSSSRSSFDQFDPSQRRGCQLHFDGKLPAALYTCCRIESEDSQPVKIVLFDASKQIISAGPQSSMQVEIIPLDGDFGANNQGEWTEEEFNAKIVHAREGKKPLVTGESVITLRNGVGEIKSVSFTDNSSWIRSRRFRLGARAVSSNSNEVRVREARSEPFMVKDQRGESSKKHHPPNLGDEIWRLEKISKGGDSRKRLSENGITTIEHFLRLYYMDPSSLRKLLGNISDKQWKTITEHATACVPDDKLYRYAREGEMGALVFNSVFKVVGVTYDGQCYHSVDKLDAVQMDWVEKMASLAYKNMNDFVQLDPLLFLSLPSNQLADPFANPSASLKHSNLARLNQDMHQFHQLALDILESSQQEEEEARKETQPQSVPVPHFEDVEIPLARQSKRARADKEGTSATGTATELAFDEFLDWSTLDLLSSPQASGTFFEEGVLPEMPSPLSPGTHATLEANEARRQAEREAKVQEAQAQLERYHGQHQSLCNLPNPQPTERPPRRVLDLESLVHPPLLPPMGLIRQGEVQLRHRRLKGHDFQVRPELLDTDSVKEPGVGARQIHAKMKPHDEQDFSGNTSEALNVAEQCPIKGIQRQVMATTNARADSAKAWANIQKFIQIDLRLLDELRQMQGKVRDLEDYRDKTLGHEQDTKRLRGEKNSLENEVRQLKGKLEEQQKIEAALHEANASMIKEHNRALEEKNHLETQLQEAKGKVEELAREPGGMDISTIRAEAVKEFLLSQICHEENESYASGFIKYGFYLARSYLENTRRGDDFADLIFSEETIKYGAPGWREFGDPDPKALEDYLKAKVGDPPNLAGSWSPYMPNPDTELPRPAGPHIPITPEVIETSGSIDSIMEDITKRILSQGEFSEAQPF